MRPPIDEERVAALTGGDAGLRRELLTLLLDEARELAARARRELAEPAMLCETAHALKGIAGNAGAPQLADAAAALEHAARSGDDGARRTAAGWVHDALARLETALSPWPGSRSSRSPSPDARRS